MSATVSKSFRVAERVPTDVSGTVTKGFANRTGPNRSRPRRGRDVPRVRKWTLGCSREGKVVWPGPLSTPYFTPFPNSVPDVGPVQSRDGKWVSQPNPRNGLSCASLDPPGGPSQRGTTVPRRVPEGPSTPLPQCQCLRTPVTPRGVDKRGVEG